MNDLITQQELHAMGDVVLIGSVSQISPNDMVYYRIHSMGRDGKRQISDIYKKIDVKRFMKTVSTDEELQYHGFVKVIRNEKA